MVGTPQSFEAYGCMMRKDDPGFKKVVDAALAKAMTSGEAEAIYKKWFHPAHPAQGPEPQLPALRRHAQALQGAQRQAVLTDGTGKGAKWGVGGVGGSPFPASQPTPNAPLPTPPSG